MTPEALARAFDRARLELEFGLRTSPDDWVARRAELTRVAPHHPLLLNLRAWEALPETALPTPGPELREVARHLLAGEPDVALDALCSTPTSARARCMRGDLLLWRGDAKGAAQDYDAAWQELGPLPPLLLRKARCANVEGQDEEAWRLCVEALVGNPLYGSARRLQLDLAERRGQWLLPLPLRITPEVGPETLEGVRRRWAREGLAEVHDRVTGLAPDSADSFRRWALREGEALRRFFAEGLVLKG